jgi:hypothetical protein
MRIAISLIGLGVAGGTGPTGLAGMAHAGIVVGGAAAALALLVSVCLAAPVLARQIRNTGARAKVAPVRHAVPPTRAPARGI